MVRTEHLTLAATALCVVIATVQIYHQQKHTSVLLQKARTQQLGEDADWDVKKWSKHHLRYVEGGAVDGTSVHNIWHNKKQAWAGIDDILPTGGRYGYESNHWMPADGAKLLGFVHHAKKEIANMEAKLPANVPKDEAKEEGEVMGVLDKDLTGLANIKGELYQPKHSAAQKARSQMLAEAQRRVYVDDALYGEGIVGDIKSQGHKSHMWSRKAAESDMDAYYDHLNAQIRADNSVRHRVQSLSHAGKPPVGSNEDLDNYFNNLDEAAATKHAEHKHILDQEGYFHTHPQEHKHLHNWVESHKAGMAAGKKEEAPKSADAKTTPKAQSGSK
mmetsp:Transcript_22113/g.44497  ORF Transcript_22113/g.44497 Transcript_22113/m.44497 type:complete len:331 (-) Transcript_22113:100-1092(-)